MNNNITRFTFLALILFAFAATIQAAEPTDDVNVLFIGNSFTSFNQLPKMVAELAKAGKLRPLNFVQVTPGGCTLEKHWKDGKALAAIQSRKWDFVVLQEQSQGPLLNKDSMFDYGKKLNAEIEKQGAKTILCMTWAYSDKPDDQTALSKAYLDLAKEINSTVAPVGSAWGQALLADKKLVLHEKDKKHPNVTGSYLAACVFYATIYGKSPEGLPGSIGKMSDEDALPLQVIAWKVTEPKEDKEKNPRTLDFFKAELKKTLTPDKAEKLFGKPDRNVGSGLLIYEYDLSDGTKLWLGFPGVAPITYAKHLKKDGTREDLELK